MRRSIIVFEVQCDVAVLEQPAATTDSDQAYRGRKPKTRFVAKPACVISAKPKSDLCRQTLLTTSASVRAATGQPPAAPS